MMKRLVHNPLLWILILGAAVKLCYFFNSEPELSIPTGLSIDALYHYRWASLIASGDIWTNAPYFRAPLYPFLLAGLLKLTGGLLPLVRLIQLFAGCLTLVLIYRIAMRLAGTTVAVLAAMLYLFYPITTFLEGELLLDAAFTLFGLTALYFILPDGEGRIRSGKSGIFFALASLTRPTILIFFPIALLYLWRRSRLMPSGTSRRLISCFIIAVLIFVAPVVIVNFVHSGQLILVSYQGGINFYIGNNPSADGMTSELPLIGQDWKLADADYLAHKESGRRLLYASQSNFWYRKGLNFCWSDPVSAFSLYARKTYLLFSGLDISDNRPLDQYVYGNPFLRFLPVRFSLLVVLAIVPLIAAPSTIRRTWIIYSIIVVYALTTAAFFVNSRFRLPLVPGMAILAATGIMAVWELIRQRRLGYRLFTALAVAAFLYYLLGTNLLRVSVSIPSEALFLRGNAALRAADYRLAKARFDSLLIISPGYPNAYLNLGIIAVKKGDLPQAIASFHAELLHYPRTAEAANNLAAVFLVQNQFDSSLSYSRQALELKPYYPEAAINLLRSRRPDTSADSLGIDAIRTRIRPYLENHAGYIFEEGLYFADHKRFHEAITAQLGVIASLESRPTEVSFDAPFSPTVVDYDRLIKLSHYQLGYLYGVTGDFRESIKYSRDAIALDPDLREAYINLVSGYRALGDVDQADSVVSEYLARWPESNQEK